MNFDDFLCFCGVSFIWKRKQIIFSKLPKNIEFLWKFQVICFFFYLDLDPKRLKFGPRSLTWRSISNFSLIFFKKLFSEKGNFRLNHPKLKYNWLGPPTRVIHKFQTICLFSQLFWGPTLLKNEFFEAIFSDFWLQNAHFSEVLAPKKKLKKNQFVWNLWITRVGGPNQSYLSFGWFKRKFSLFWEYFF